MALLTELLMATDGRGAHVVFSYVSTESLIPLQWIVHTDASG